LCAEDLQQVNAIGERGVSDDLAQGASNVLRDAGSATSSILVAGSTGIDDGELCFQDIMRLIH
jgi:hypothetical protein